MVLSSSAYFIFLVGVFFLYWPVARYRALSLAVILFANYFFYAKWASFYPSNLADASTHVPTRPQRLEKKDNLLPSADGGKALSLIALGLTKKLLIADCLADNLVNRVFDFPKLYTASETLIAVYGFALQLYYDFSGYTDIAIGSALLLAIKLPPNFNMPYAAENIPDFCRRWHISVSNLLRDYLS